MQEYWTLHNEINDEFSNYETCALGSNKETKDEFFNNETSVEFSNYEINAEKEEEMKKQSTRWGMEIRAMMAFIIYSEQHLLEMSRI